MKFELDDNSRGALHYLIAGATVVLVLLGIGWVLEHFFAASGVWRSFSHGYLIHDDGLHLITADTGLGERMATALVLAFVGALVVGAVTALAARLLGMSSRRPALIMARIVFAITFGYGGYAALFLPPGEFIGYRDRTVILWQRSTILSDLPWPGTKTIHLIPWDGIAEMRTREVEITSGAGQVRVECVLKDGSIIPLGNASTARPGNSAAMSFAIDRAEGLSRMIAPQ